MTKTASAAARGMTATRSGASRALLKLKAVERVAEAVEGQQPIEALFPAQPSEAARGGGESLDIKESSAGPADALTPADAEPPAPALTPAAWTDEDETLFQSLSARRKASGFQRRGRDVSGQMLKVGNITPGAGTVYAVVAETLGAAGTVSRGSLLDMLMALNPATTKYPNKPRAWWQGYVAGALRDGVVAEEAVSADAPR